jgi:Family of unknown function (DUF6209)
VNLLLHSTYQGGEKCLDAADSALTASLTVEVPTDATKVELWFKNTDNTGCVAWDSRYGQNYWFDVTPT